MFKHILEWLSFLQTIILHHLRILIVLLAACYFSSICDVVSWKNYNLRSFYFEKIIYHLFYFLLSAYFRLYKCICCCFYKVLKFLVFDAWGRTDNLADSKFRFYLVWKNGIGKGSKCFFSSDSKATDLIVEWTKQSAFDAIGFTYLLTSA